MSIKVCPLCKKEKSTVGPKIIAKTKTNNPRLSSQNDVLLTKIMCQGCLEELKRKTDG